MKYLFILGNNPELSVAEITAILPQAKILKKTQLYLAVDSPKIDCQRLMDRLGGTIKIGLVLGAHPDVGPITGSAMSKSGGRFNFGLSFYGQKPSNWGLGIKKQLKGQGISSRLVTSREPALSSVIITKEKCQDYIITPEFFAQTCAVQDFKEFGKRDFGRPAADAYSGMLPPKAAKMMINLSGAQTTATVLDPFCGSGTILSEALALGYTDLIGTDLSDKAVADSQKNLQWLAEELKIKDYKLKIEKLDVRELSKNFDSVDAIITEPYLGKPIRGNENAEQIKSIIAELSDLYLSAFRQFKKVLAENGKIVMIFPEWHLHGKIYRLNISERVSQLGFKRLDSGDLYYKREDQKVWRNITIWQ
ncbi:MAG: DNA methyltransferase [Patescibacteria group bacterium]|jgi:tRNA G10  N-methylase Trm11